MAAAPLQDREFDLVVFGATGYTGALVAEALARHPEASALRWALAGRNADKLAAAKDAAGVPDSVTLVLADASDPQSIDALAQRAACILTTVGPYERYGEPLLSACAKAGTHYVDLCGEPLWMRRMIDTHEAAAQASGARIVFSCGFDSIPFDLGVAFLQAEAQRRFNAPLRAVHGRVRQMRGTFSGGTAASFHTTMAVIGDTPALMDRLRDPFALTPGFAGPEQPRMNRPREDETLGVWMAPFVMAPINTKIIHRSNAMRAHAYGQDFAYDEMWVTGPGEEGEKTAKYLAEADLMGGDNPPKPGEGPTKEEREAGFYDVLFYGAGPDGAMLKASVKGDADPGYGSTSKMIVEAARGVLAQDAMPGGIWTPASAFGLDLVAPLTQYAGLTFAIEE